MLRDARAPGGAAPRGAVVRRSFQARLPEILAAATLILGLALVGCTGFPVAEEQAAQAQQQQVERKYRPAGQRKALSELGTAPALADLLRFAMLNQPQVEAAYYDWAASVQRITVERSLPDPKLSFEADIADIVMALIPGLMIELPGPGKLGAAARVASAESEASYFAFASSVLQAAFSLKRAYYQLYFLDARLAVSRETLALVGDLEALARVRNAVGAVTLQDVLRAQIEQERLAIEIANLEDSRQPLSAQLAAALGLEPGSAAPALPAQLESTPLDVTPEQLFATALESNPRLAAMEAELRRAEAVLQLAYKLRVPDFGLGLEADAKASPVVIMPQVSISLPIWRDKIAAAIAAARADRRAAEARLSAEQIQLAVDFAENLFAYRESTRNLELLRERLLPKASQSLDVARAGYGSGRAGFLDLIEAERTLLDFQLGEVEALTQRELALSGLSLLIAGVAPAGAPLAAAVEPAPARREENP